MLPSKKSFFAKRPPETPNVAPRSADDSAAPEVPEAPQPPKLGGFASGGRGGTATPAPQRGFRSLGGTAPLTATEREWKRAIFEHAIAALDLSRVQQIGHEEARREIEAVCRAKMASEPRPVSEQGRRRIVEDIQNEMLGLGPLEPLLNDLTISDILVNGYDKVFVERHGKLTQENVRFDDNRHLQTIIERIVSQVGRRVDESSPMVDARLPDGSRVNAIVPPLAIDGPALSIRRFPQNRPNMESLVDRGSLSPAMAQVLEVVVKARLNVLISGGTGSGKTTMLNILSSYIPANERIVTIEDSAELQLQQAHVVRLETRPPNIEGRGEITQRDLVRNALRMRPDRIILGEVRAAEALDMLQAMNTGHDGSLATIHANTPRDALGRVENMVAMSGINLPARNMRSQIASAIDVVLQLERQEDGKRRVVSVDEVQGMEGEIITMATIFRFERKGMDNKGHVIGNHVGTGIVPKFQERIMQRGLRLDPRVYRSDAF